jgi:short-subunit dehydrogenase
MSWAIVTGASAGLGVEFAKLCAQDGNSVILVARRRDRLEALAEELQVKYKIKTLVIELDLAAPGAAKQLYSQALAVNSPIDILINNAGFGATGAFPAPSLDRQSEMIDLNIKALVEITAAFLPQMLTRKKGRILNVGSLAGFQPGPYMSVYYASKAFVNSFSEALHEETKGTGVTCTVLAPGPVHTEFGKISKMDTSRIFKTPTVSAAEVAKVGYLAMRSGSAMAIPGITNKILPQVMRLIPRFLIRKTAGWLNRTAGNINR